MEGDKAYYAQWQINNYRITFDANDGLGGEIILELNFGARITPPTVTRDGYIFDKWLPSVPQYVPDSDTTYVAQWIE